MEATFCFVDLAGFAALTEAHGDHAAADLALAFGRLVEQVLQGAGQVVDTVGDAVFVVAERPAEAVRFVGRLFDRAATEPDFPALRAGLHHGEAVVRNDRYFGTSVNLAARVASQAGGDEVLATRGVADAARAVGVDATSRGTVALRNLLEPVELFVLAIGRFPETVIDPVCRMRVERHGAAGRLRFQGTEYFFCSLDCTARFAARPAAYAAGEAPASRS